MIMQPFLSLPHLRVDLLPPPPGLDGGPEGEHGHHEGQQHRGEEGGDDHDLQDEHDGGVAGAAVLHNVVKDIARVATRHHGHVESISALESGSGIHFRKVLFICVQFIFLSFHN